MLAKVQAAARSASVHEPIPAIMIQGTASNAGKSIITAALCRSLVRSGVDVAPFKAQNMSLNSWVTADGGEIGVAQALQARACGLTPDVRMNPVLLKPMGDAGSQVIVLGTPIGIMPYGDYVRRKPQIWSEITDAYRTLAQEHQAMILEGAGSPAEINLRSHDVVNMSMAHFARAKVILTADIDVGGAFAALVGTLCLLPPEDRKLIRAFILNKFRGDRTLLLPALEQISGQWKRPFAGIMPMLELQLPQEDSVSLGISERPAPPGYLDLAIIALPAMSNMADFAPLMAHAHVHCRLVRHTAQLGEPHAVLIPGSRHVPQSLAYLRHNGLFVALQNYGQRTLRKKRGQLVGLCAGMQIIGEHLADPHALEGGGNHICLGLLPLRTILAEEKCLGRKEALALPPLTSTPMPCIGNEIHHGQVTTNLRPLVLTTNNEAIGWGNGHIWGTWLHGIFDDNAFRQHWLNNLAAQWNMTTPPVTFYDLDRELDKLADALEANMDMDLIHSLLLTQ